MKQKIRTHEELEVFKMAFEAAMEIFALSKSFPKEERYSLTDQIRRASRSVCSNSAEAFRKRRYAAAFIGRLSDAEAEAAETQVWLKFAMVCEYLTTDKGTALYTKYDHIIGKIVNMIIHPEDWTL